MFARTFFRKFPIALWLAALVIATPAWSQNYERGLSAYSRLDYETALREWSESAIAGERQGEAKAQNNLGVMYENGHGLPIDLDIAIYWYEEAARKGNRNARANLHRLTTAGAAFRD